MSLGTATKKAKQCVHSALFPLLLYGFLYYQNMCSHSKVIDDDDAQSELHSDLFSDIPDKENTETETLDPDAAIIN
jgi:hypothetical protein